MRDIKTHPFFCTAIRCRILALKLAKKIMNMKRIINMVIFTAFRGLAAAGGAACWLRPLPPPSTGAGASAMVLLDFLCWQYYWQSAMLLSLPLSPFGATLSSRIQNLHYLHDVCCGMVGGSYISI